MQRPNIELEWEGISEKLMNRFPKLTPADLVFKKGLEDEMIDRICVKLKKSRNDVLALIATL